MKPGCYLCDDKRTAPERPATGVVRIYPSTTDDSIIIRNLAGYGEFRLEIDDEHPQFVDDGTIIVLPTASGNLTLRWPTAEDFDALALDFNVANWPTGLSSDEERQTFLRSLTGDV